MVTGMLDAASRRRIGVALAAGLTAIGGATVIASTGGDDGNRVVTDAGSDALDFLELSGESGLRLQASDENRLGTLVIPEIGPGRAPSETTALPSTTSSTTSTSETDDGSTTSTTPTGEPPATAAEAPTDPSTTTAPPRTTAAPRSTTTTRATTTTRRQTTTTRPTTTTTRPTTTTTRPTTTTTRPTTTTTRPTTTTTNPPGNSCSSGAEFELVMRDDFNGSSVGDQWHVWPAGTNHGFGPRRRSNLWVSNGILTIAAGVENGTLYTGGMNHHLAQTYGKYVFKVRTDIDPDKAMSGVVLTWPASGVHPRDGENNIYETLPHQDSPTRDPFYTFIHKPYGSTSDQEYKIHHADGTQWQTMTMEWTPSRITVVREGPGGSNWRDEWTVWESSADLIPDVPHRFHVQFDAWKHWISSSPRMQLDFAEVHKYCG